MNAQLQIHVQLQELFAEINHFMSDREYQHVFPTYCAALRAYSAYHQGQTPNCGSVAYNQVEHLFTHINLSASASLSRQVSAQRAISLDGSAGPGLLTSGTGPEDAITAVSLAHDSLKYPGITNTQRFLGHCCRAVAYANMGDFMVELLTVVPEPERTTILARVPPSYADAPRCYKKAAQDAFYAAHVPRAAGADNSRKLLDYINTLRLEMCAKIGQDPDEQLAQMHRSGLARHQVPVLGLWEGDPALSKRWGPDRMTLMALFRNSSRRNGDRLVGDFARRGIRWNHNVLGEIFLQNSAWV